MKQAILVQCHKKPEQVNLLLNALDDPDLDIYIHIDKKSNMESRPDNKYIFCLMSTA